MGPWGLSWLSLLYAANVTHPPNVQCTLSKSRPVVFKRVYLSPQSVVATAKDVDVMTKYSDPCTLDLIIRDAELDVP